MIKVGRIHIFNMYDAVLGIRNAHNSWDESDSCCDADDSYFLGEKDIKLCQKLIKAGTSDRKFLRMIHVNMRVTAPLYWWKEADQYKVGTTTNSTSTMHSLSKKDLTLDDFSIENTSDTSKEVLTGLIDRINNLRAKFEETKDKTYWDEMIQLLPSSYNQMRTWDLDYETLINIYTTRRFHKLQEWRDLCDIIKGLPYMDRFLEPLLIKAVDIKPDTESIENEKLLEGFRKIFDHYGYSNQALMLAEESGELIKAINKYYRFTNSKVSLDMLDVKKLNSLTDDIIGEMADVLVMLKQFQISFHIKDETLNAKIKEKVERQIGRIDTEEKNAN